MSEEQVAAKEETLKAKQTEVDSINEKRLVDGPEKDGKVTRVYPKGTLLRMGQTRGKNPQIVVWEAFDESLPETLPVNLKEFMELTKVADEKSILSFVIDGFNSAQYTAASDPIAEYVNPAWPDDVQKQFRMAVRSYSNSADASIEDAVALIKPGVEKKFAAAQAK